MMQVLQSALIPGNANADNIAEELRAFPHLFYPSKPIQHVQLEVGLITSFGFGQVGGQIAVVHPRYLFAALRPDQYNAYVAARGERQLEAYSRMSSAMTHNNLVQIKEGPPYTPELEAKVLLNPLARASASKDSYAFGPKMPQGPALALGNLNVMGDVLYQASGVHGVG